MKDAEELEDVSLESLVAQVADDFTERLGRGEQPEIERYASRYPQIATVLRQVLPALEVVSKLPMKAAPTRDLDGASSQVAGCLGDFRIICEIGRGGMGVVYEAEQISLHRKVALKVLPFAAVLDSKHLQRFKNEAHAAAGLHHQNIVPIYSVGCERGVHYYAMQYVEGQTLAEVIRDLRRLEGLDGTAPQQPGEVGSGPADSLASGRFTPPTEVSRPEHPVAPHSSERTPDAPLSKSETAHEPQAAISTERSTKSRAYFRSVAELGIQIAEALDHAHEHGVIHRDIKPSNVILDTQGKAWIADFGLARIETDATLTMTGDLLGTLRYMSPEQALAKRLVVDHRTDIYSLGATLYELLTLQPALTGQDREELLRQLALNEPRPPRRLNRAIPAELETIVLVAIAKDPTERYDTAKELADDLRRLLEGRPIRARRTRTLERAWRWCRRNPVVAGLSALLGFWTVAVAVVAIFAALHQAKLRATADAEQRRAEQLAIQEAATRREVETTLFRARLSEARAWRMTRQLDWSRPALEALEQNAQMNIDPEDRVRLRSEAIACASQLDVRYVATLYGHGSGGVTVMDFSPDGSRLISADHDGKVFIWDTKKEQKLWDLAGLDAAPVQRGEPVGPPRAVRFHPKSGTLAYGTQQGTVDLIPVQGDDKPRLRIEGTALAECLDFDRQGDLMAVAWTDNRVVAYDAATGKPLREIQTHGRCVAVSPDGRLLATVGPDNTVQLHQIAEDDEPTALGSHEAEITVLRFSPDGSLLASGSSDHTAIVFQVTAQKEVARLLGHTFAVNDIAFHPHADLVATGGDRTVRLWNPRSGQAVMVLRPEIGPIPSVAFTPDGRHLAAACCRIVMYRLENLGALRPLVGHRDTIDALAFDPEKPVLYSGSWDGNVIRWDLRSARPQLRWTAHPSKGVKNVAVSPDGKWIAAGHERYFNKPSDDYRVRVWEASTGDIHQMLEGHAGDVWCVEFDPTGRLLATGDRKGTAIVWDIAAGKRLAGFHEDEDPINAVAFFAEDSRLIVGRHSGRVRIRDVESGKTIQEAKVLDDLSALAVTPDGRRLAAVNDRGHLVVVTLPELELVATLDQGHRGVVHDVSLEGPVWAVTFSPDGRLLVSGGADRRVILWDFAGRQKLAELPEHHGSVFHLAFAPDGNLLAVGGMNEQLTLWDLRAVRERLAQFRLDWSSPP